MTHSTTRSRCLTMTEAAEYLGVTVRTLREWKQRNYGPPSFPAGRRRMFLQSDIDAWIVAQRDAS